MSDTPPCPYRAGQVWRYHTRPGEPDSTLTITRVETFEAVGTVVHVSVTGLTLRNPHVTGGGVIGDIAHVPFAETAIDASVVELLRQDVAVAPALGDGYDTWRSAYDAGEAGVFSIPVRDAVEYMEQALNS
ncbi:MAG TPA: hypothetical protein VFQ39_00170 [Longimicrobium sp.]|nr:hypothetical protein [Longimicrobium sp.]